MVQINAQFSRLLKSITIALVVASTIDALPQLEAKEDLATIELPPDIDIAVKAPLMNRGNGGSPASRARMARQVEAAILFEASRLAHAKERRSHAARDMGLIDEDDTESSETTESGEVKRDHKHHHHHHHGHSHHHGHKHGHKHVHHHGDEALVISGDHNHVHSQSHRRATDEVVMTGDHNHVHTHSHKGHKPKGHHHGHHYGHHAHGHHHGHGHGHHDHDTVIMADSPLVISGDGNHVHSHSHKRGYHHHPDDHSKGGHSDHWFEHHGLKAGSHHHGHHHHHHGHHHSHHGHHGHHHHHHHHHHGKRSRPSRLEEPDHSDDTFVAPLSARPVVANQVPKSKSKDGDKSMNTNKDGKEVKHAKNQTEWKGKEDKASKWDEDESDSDDDDEKEWDKRDEGSLSRAHSNEMSTRQNATAASLATKESSQAVSPSDPANNDILSGTPGVIDLMRGSPDGEKLGGLSISAFPSNETDAGSIHNSTTLALLIDSTPHLIEQTTFYVHEFEDQSLLDAEYPATQAVRDILIALEVPYTPNMTEPEAPAPRAQKMCATFNPLEPDVQSFGLTLCMDQDDALNDRRMSQAFRYSTSTGILKPFYGSGGEREKMMLAAVNDQIAQMDKRGWNGTGVYDLDPHTGELSDLTSSMSCSNSTYPMAMSSSSMLNPHAAHFLRMNATAAEDPIPTLTSTTSISATPSALGNQVHGALIIGDSDVKATSNDMGVIMVFRSTLDAKEWRRTKEDVDTLSNREKALKAHQDVGLAKPGAKKLAHWDAMDALEDSDDAPVPKPVINVAYFGDSGRSAPVPPEDQADSAHPIMLAYHDAHSPKLAAVDPVEDEDKDATPLFISSPPVEDPVVMAAVQPGRMGPMGIPVDASD